MSKKEEAPVMDGYKTIEIGKQTAPVIKKDEKPPEEVLLEDVTDGEQEVDVKVDLDSGDIVEDKDTTTDEDSLERDMGAAPIKIEGELEKFPKKKKEAPVKKQEEKRPSRAKKRIKQLHTEKQAVQAELEQERIKNVALQTQLNQGSLESKEALKASIEANMTNLTKGMQEAIESGDSEEAVRLSVETTNAQMQLAGLASELSNIEQRKEQEKVAPKPQLVTQEIPEKAIDWIEDYPEFKSDPLFHNSAMTVSNMLVGEGFDDQSEDFYNELTSRLSPRFPEVFGTDDENDVKYNKDDKNSSNEDEDGNNEASQVHDEMDTQQTVSSSSRTPPHKKGSKGRGGKTVSLSPQMVNQAERWGLSLEQVARRVAHNEKNRRDDGYVSIEIKKS